MQTLPPCSIHPFLPPSLSLSHSLIEGEIESLLSASPEGSNYSPFETKMHALAYILLNTPRPLVQQHYFILKPQAAFKLY